MSDTTQREKTPAPLALKKGMLLADRYELIDVLGRGGFGVVYKARQKTTDQLVAVKMLLTQDDAPVQRQRFLRELQVLAKLNHPHLVQLIDTGDLDGNTFMVLEFVDGTTLRDRLNAQGAMKASTAKRILGQVLEALEAAHDHGIIHRDLKPPNIMLTGSSRRPVVKVLDFGVALATPTFNGQWEALTAEGILTGTPHYVAPEVLTAGLDEFELKHPITFKSDLYAMGLIFYECLTGRRAVPGNTAFEVCINQVKKELEIPPELEVGGIGDFLRKACQKNPDARFESAADMLEALEAVEAPSHVLGEHSGSAMREDSSEYSLEEIPSESSAPSAPSIKHALRAPPGTPPKLMLGKKKLTKPSDSQQKQEDAAPASSAPPVDKPPALKKTLLGVGPPPGLPTPSTLSAPPPLPSPGAVSGTGVTTTLVEVPAPSPEPIDVFLAQEDEDTSSAPKASPLSPAEREAALKEKFAALPRVEFVEGGDTASTNPDLTPAAARIWFDEDLDAHQERLGVPSDIERAPLTQKKTPRLLLPALLLAGLLGVVLLYAALRNAPEGEGEAEASTTKKGATPATPPSTTLTLTSAPAGAVIRSRPDASSSWETRGPAPQELTLTHPVELELTLPEHEPLALTLDPASPPSLPLKLTPWPEHAWKLQSTPAARVLLDQEEVCASTPCTYTRRAKEASPLTFTFVAPDHEEQTRELAPDKAPEPIALVAVKKPDKPPKKKGKIVTKAIGLED